MVELGVNSAAFKSGLDAATYQAQQFAKQVSGSFSALEDSIKGIGESFAQLDPAIGGAINGITSALGPLTASLGTVGGATAGFAAALVGAGVGAIGIAAHFAETAARLGELSQATGISVEQLSLLGNVAATKGIGVDQMAKALERMDKNALAAAQSGPKSANAFRDLGVAVTNADGSMRSAQDIFDAISIKFASMPDGPLKTAEAMKIFGRTGAELIPLLNEGGAKLGELEAHFKALGAVISGPTAEAAEKFKENTTLMGAAFAGIENRLTADLLPALNVVAEAFVGFFEKNQDGVKAFADGLAEVAKVTLNVFQEVGLIFSLLYRAFYTAVDEIQVLGGTLGKVLGDVANGDFNQIWGDIKTGSSQAASEMTTNFNRALDSIKATGANMVGVLTAKLPGEKTPSGPQPDPQKAPDTSFVDKQVNALERLAAKEQALAEAVGKATESQIDANAAATAGEAIQKLMDEAVDKGIATSRAFKAALDAAIPRIQAAAIFESAFKAAIGDQTELDNFNKKLAVHMKELEGVGEASSAAAKEQAKNNAALLPLRDNLAQLGAELEKLQAQYGSADPRVRALGEDYFRQSLAVKAATDATEKLNAQVKENAGKNEVAVQDAKVKALQDMTLALRGNSEANVKAAVAAEEFRLKTGASDAAVQKFKADLLAENAELQKQAAQKLATPGGSQQAQDLKIQIDYLTSLNGKWNEQTKAVNNYTQALNQVNADYQDLLAKNGNFAQGATAAFADFAKGLQSSGQLMQKEITTALNGISQNFATMIATGKASWQGLVTSMEEMLLKSSLSNILNSLFKSISSALGGQGGALGSLGSIFGGGHATGGDVTPGKSYLVGEQGPELLKVGAAGASIIPNGQFGGGGNSGTVNVIQNISATDASSFKQSAGQLHAQAMAQASRSFQRFSQ